MITICFCDFYHLAVSVHVLSFMGNKTFFMNSIAERIEVDEILHSIVFAYEGRILSDIKKDFDKPEVVGFLAGNLLTQFSGFLFAGSPKERVRSFVDNYLRDYREVDLCDIFENHLRHDFVDTLKTIVPVVPVNKKIRYEFHYERRIYVSTVIE